MKTIFAKIFSAQIAATACVICIMAAIFLIAVRTSIATWNEEKKSDIEELMVRAISKTYRLSGSLSQTELARALSPFITDSLFVYVFDVEKNPLLLIEQGKTLSLQEVEKNAGPISTFLSLNKPVAVKDGEATIAFLCVDSIDFLAYRANRIFISTMQKAVAAGTLLALAIAAILSRFISLSLAKKAESLSDSISSPELFNSNSRVEKTGINEFDKIVNSVSELKSRLIRESGLRNQWMQDISHDLKTPLTAVKMQVEGMKDGVLAASDARFEALYSELMLTERLVLGLQELCRYESPEMKINAKKIDIPKFIEAIDERFSLIAKNAGVNYKSRFENCCEKKFSFVADYDLLFRCVSNILQNAVQYAGKNGRVEFIVAAKTQGGSDKPLVTLTALNSGSVAESDLPYIFDRLYRGDHSRTSAGSGLGLSIVKAIVKLHGGNVFVRNLSEGGEGVVQTRIEL